MGQTLLLGEALRLLSDGIVLADYTGGLRKNKPYPPSELIERVPGQSLTALQLGFIGDILAVVDQPILPAERE